MHSSLIPRKLPSLLDFNIGEVRRFEWSWAWEIWRRINGAFETGEGTDDFHELIDYP
jgi:hypothetical protein